jgi:branched-chain amino acid transport system ATP-binding protein
MRQTATEVAGVSEPRQSSGTEPGADADERPFADGTATPGADASVSDDPILEVRDLRKEFGGIVAVDGATFSIERGAMTGLIGPNGAGKSTTFNCITGVHRPDGGTVVFDGTEVTGLRPEQVATRGLVRTFQIARELPEMTVIENMMLGPKDQLGESLWRSVTPGARGRVVRQEQQLLEHAWETLEFFEIDHLAGERASSLSGGQRKLLELARALSTDPDLLLLDEPMAGVNPSLEEKLLDRLHELRTRGYSFLVVEHDMDMIMNNCEHVVVMHQGQVLAEGDPADVRSNDRVIDAYLGGDV